MRPAHRLTRFGALLPFACALLHSPATTRASVIPWTAPVSGSFQDPARWTGGAVPGTADQALFDLAPTPFMVTLASNANTDQLFVRNGQVTLDLSGRTYGLNLLTVGDQTGDSGHLIITGGTMTSTAGCQGIRLGNSSGSTGELTLTGPTTVLNMDVGVADAGLGILTISNGATLNSGVLCVGGAAGSLSGTAQVTVTGAGSTWHHTTQMWFAAHGHGTLTVSNGGRIVTTDLLGLGQNGTGQAMVTITGAGSRWEGTTGGLFVADGGQATMVIENGGSLNLPFVDIGRTPVSVADVTVRGAGSSINTSSPLVVGEGGHGSLTIQDGASVSTGYGVLSYFAGAQGSVVVTGPGSTWTCPPFLEVGYNGVGTLTVSNGAVVSVGAPSQFIYNYAAILGDATVVGTIENYGHIRPGLPTGTLTINGDYEQFNVTPDFFGTLHIELGGGVGGSEYDRLAVTGAARLDGTLDIALINGFVPSLGQTFEVLRYASHTGHFANVTGLALGGGRVFRLDYGPTALTLTAVSISSLQVQPASSTIYQGFTTKVSAIAQTNPPGAADITLAAAWTSDNAAIATVANGVVRGQGAGSTTIRAGLDSFHAAATVSVLPLPNPLATTAVSQGSTDSSIAPSMSANGRYISFPSHDSGLVPNDTNNAYDVFVYDRESIQTTRVSVDSAGNQGNNQSEYASISADGQFVAFVSFASNLVANDSNNTWDIFVHDRQSHQTTRVSIDSAGSQANGPSANFFPPAISEHGQFVVFASLASNLVSNDSNGTWDVFRRDRQLGQTVRVSEAPAGADGNSASGTGSVRISPDGRYVLFDSNASNLVPGDTNNGDDIFLKDMLTGAIERVNLTSTGQQMSSSNGAASMSDDRRYVAFEGPNAPPAPTQLFVRDRQLGTTTLVSVDNTGQPLNANSFRPRLTPDGRFMAFYSLADNVVPCTPGNGFRQVYVRDLPLGRNYLITRNLAGEIGNENSSQREQPAISQDGRYVAYFTVASNLIPFDTNGATDVLLTDRQLLFPLLTADMNCDCAVDGLDVQGFVDALLNPAGYDAGHPACYLNNADVNLDGVLNAADVPLFVQALLAL